MYLISIYFDERTNHRIQRYIDSVAERTGNRFMQEWHVPPHITISAFEAKDEEKIKELFKSKFSKWKRGNLTWCSVGMFLPYVIYVSPVLNDYIHNLSKEIYDCLLEMDDVEVSKCYRPFQWFPHTTIGKKLSKEEMKIAFETLQECFGVFTGTVTEIGLAKPNPHRDLLRIELGKEDEEEIK